MCNEAIPRHISFKVTTGCTSTQYNLLYLEKIIVLRGYGGHVMINLAAGKCVACRGGEPTLTDVEIDELLLHVHQWEVAEVDGMKRLGKTFKFKNFAQALEFTNKVGAVAEEENHHPLIITEWGRVRLQWWTHKIGGLHKNDFIMAAKSDEIY